MRHPEPEPEALHDEVAAEATVEMPSVRPAAFGQAGPEAAARSRQPSPYEAVIRRLLESAAQKQFEELAGPAADGIVVRVSLEWRDPEQD